MSTNLQKIIKTNSFGITVELFPLAHKHSLYPIWNGMLGRCHNSNHPAYKYYGKRGIIVCDAWKSFINFINDVSPRLPNTSLDRINNDDNYYKENCRWATRQEQRINRACRILLTFNGITKNLSEWSDEYKIPRSVLASRRYLGWSVQEILTTPVLYKPTIGVLTFEGRTQDVANWARELHIQPDTIYRRIRIGLPMKYVLTTQGKPTANEK